MLLFFCCFFIKSRFNTVFLFFCEGQNNGITIFYDPSAIYSLNVVYLDYSYVQSLNTLNGPKYQTLQGSSTSRPQHLVIKKVTQIIQIWSLLFMVLQIFHSNFQQSKKYFNVNFCSPFRFYYTLCDVFQNMILIFFILQAHS